jgi:multiple sugar transport system ATP-binding protein
LLGQAEPRTLPVEVAVVEELGSDAYLHGRHVGVAGESLDPNAVGGAPVIARVDPEAPPAKGERVWLRIHPGREHFYSVTTGDRLPA